MRRSLVQSWGPVGCAMSPVTSVRPVRFARRYDGVSIDSSMAPLPLPSVDRGQACTLFDSHFRGAEPRISLGSVGIHASEPDTQCHRWGVRRRRFRRVGYRFGGRGNITVSGCQARRLAYRRRWGYPSIESVVREGRTYTSLRDVADVTVSRRRVFFRSACGSRACWDPDCS